ncbi:MULTISPECIES: sel1 repeat family protein [Providencia]|uniref:Sel1 repeat family protein n=2 Tax=Morganellaceae TaxID=1903414 RepID=A0AA42K2W8_9GAMM|nr:MULTISPECIES: sel1 repeat family protein [Providencia]MDG4697757.1 sel1 repeat family protein [Providencia sp. CRE-3FA-0001]MDO7833014.1 sel1 repeat family protein [Providencia sp. CRE-138-0026]MDO7855962.1 sel1 repeat family protein [Providencia sp. CRE-138-0111]UFK93713.1 sel1 repeat family protein [Providencia rettgeri]
MMGTPTWGGNTTPPLIPTVRDRLYTIGYNETELRYDSDLPKRVPYPKNQQQVVELYHRALKSNKEDDNYALFSFFRIGCTDFKHLHNVKVTKEECALANFFLKRVLEINSNNGLALLFTGVNYQHGNGGEINMPEAILYYEQAYHLYGNKVLTAGKNLSTIYLHGLGGGPQDFNKAKYYLEMVARDNPKGQDAYYLKNFDTYVDLLKISNEGDKCKQQNPNNRTWVNECNDKVEKQIKAYLKKYRDNQKNAIG